MSAVGTLLHITVLVKHVTQGAIFSEEMLSVSEEVFKKEIKTVKETATTGNECVYSCLSPLADFLTVI